MTIPDEIKHCVDQYQYERGMRTESCLGMGTQGTVLVFNNPSRSERIAVKFHNRQAGYERERDVYFRLRDLDLTEIRNHEIPQLVNHHDHLLALEMTIVSPPFVLDFGGAWLDFPPDYSPEVWTDWRKQKSRDFAANWPAVRKIIAEFEQYGIHIADVNPGNIRF